MLAQNIRYLRKLHKLTQKQLSEKLRIDTSSISKYEVGFIIPSIDVLQKMTKLFKFSIDDLMKINLSEVSIQKQKPNKTKKEILEKQLELLFKQGQECKTSSELIEITDCMMRVMRFFKGS